MGTRGIAAELSVPGFAFATHCHSDCFYNTLRECGKPTIWLPRGMVPKLLPPAARMVKGVRQTFHYSCRGANRTNLHLCRDGYVLPVAGVLEVLPSEAG